MLQTGWRVNDPTILQQFGGEVIHFTLLALVGGISSTSAVIAWLVRRDISRSEKENERRETERGLKLAELGERFDDHVRRSGSETKDIQYRMGIMATQVKRVIPEVTIPEWPSR